MDFQDDETRNWKLEIEKKKRKELLLENEKVSQVIFRSWTISIYVCDSTASSIIFSERKRKEEEGESSLPV